MTMRRGLPAKLAATDADDTRYALSGLVVCNADGTPRGGVLSPIGANLVTATATMNVSVARFQAAAVRDSGVVLLANDGPANVLLDSAPAANSRIDVIWAKQNDASSTVSVPDANNSPVLGVSKGTAAAVPSKPSIPAGAVELATVAIPSTATATNSSGVVVSQSAPFAAAAGSLVPFRSKAELDLWTTAGEGQRARTLDLGIEFLRVGSAWKEWTSGWIPFVPASTDGITLGAGGSAVFSLRYVAGDVEVKFKFTFGGGSGLAWSLPSFRLPVPVHASVSPLMKVGSGAAVNGAGFWELTVNYVDATYGARVYLLGGNPLTFSVFGAGTPFAPATGHYLTGRIVYTPA